MQVGEPPGFSRWHTCRFGLWQDVGGGIRNTQAVGGLRRDIARQDIRGAQPHYEQSRRHDPGSPEHTSKRAGLGYHNSSLSSLDHRPTAPAASICSNSGPLPQTEKNEEGSCTAATLLLSQSG